MYELRCLGEATLRTSDGELVHFRSRKHLALLIYLALNADRAHRRERLASMLWTDSDEARARHSLSQALYAVRRLLNGAVRIEGDDLEIDTDGMYVDVLALHRYLENGDAASAADLFRGDFLEGFWVRGAHGYEEWVFHERARLAALARDALRKAISVSHDRCDWSDVRARAERLIGLEPYDEHAYAELMRALWMLGDRAAALDRYQGLKRLLADELQAIPSKEIEALAQRIRERPVRGGWKSPSLLREPDSALFVDPPFVGRKRELAALAEQWRIVATGESRTVALVGGAGIGKTRLATEFIQSLELEDVTVLRGRCYEAEQSLPYGPIAEALRQGLDKLDLTDVNPLWLAEVARVVPEVRDPSRGASDVAQMDAEGGKRRLYEGFAQCFRSACDFSPVVLLVDDLHWADDSSLELLHYLQRRVTNGLLLLLAYRPEEVIARKPDSAATVIFESLAFVSNLSLSALTMSEIAALLCSLVRPDQGDINVDTLLKMSCGNPFFAIELARHASESNVQPGTYRSEVPESIRALVNRRLSRLSDKAVAVAQQATLFGTRFSLDVLAAATELPPFDLHIVLEELMQVGVIVEGGDNLSFRHDLMREVAATHITPSLLRTLHLRAATALIVTNGGYGEIAAHFDSAGNSEGARKWALRGANQAERIFAFREAAELLSLALRNTTDESLREPLLLRLGKLYTQLCEYDKARPLLEERLSYVRKTRDTAIVLEARRDLLFVHVYSSSLTMSQAGEALWDLSKELGKRVDTSPETRVDVLATLFWTAARSFDTTLAERAINRLRQLHETAGTERLRYKTAKSLGIYERYQGRLESAENLLQEALMHAKALSVNTG